jgi:phage-related protein
MDIKKTGSTKINVSPTFGSSASFSSLQESTDFGDNHSQRMLKGLNSLKMFLNLNFEELTDRESNDLISYLQSHTAYEIQNYSTAGKFDNKRVEPFRYQPFFPYREKDFYCFSFTHQKPYFNCNSVSAQFQCAAPSILESVESSAGHNSNIDSLINATLNASSSCKDNAVVLNPNDKIYHSGDYSVATIDSTYNPSVGFSQTLSATSDFPFSSGRISSNQTPLRHSIFINNPNECFYYPYNPIHEDGALETRMFDFRPTESISLQYSPKYRRSTVSEMYQKFNLYGFNPNLSNLQLNFEGKSDIEAKRILLFLESHLGYKKFGFHVLRDYVGSSAGSPNRTPHRRTLSSFYCPEWSHTFNYKNNHSISATFIECIDY